MSKTEFNIKEINKNEAKKIIVPYHYLSSRSKGFKSGFNYGLYYDNKIVGVCIFTGLPVPELAKGMVGQKRQNQEGLFELSRLCLEPHIQKNEHNLASWFVSRCIRLLKKAITVKLILSYADADFHNGVVYAACNFKYYGLTAPKVDFYFKNSDGSFTKHRRGKVRGFLGEWRKRSQKHRFLMVFDSSLKVKWVEKRWVNKEL